MNFQSRLVKTNVTAISIAQKHILAGIGGFINVFEKDTGILALKINIFEGQEIHGIVLSNDQMKLLIYGGTHLTIFSTNHELDCFKQLFYNIHSDWILTAKWIENDNNISVLYMHNKLSTYSHDLQIVTETECKENCILYSGHICYNKVDDLIVLSGTVFSEVLIWSPTCLDGNNKSIVLYRLKQHNGVIFSVDYNENLGYICSSSDDRSAILWKVKNKSLKKEEDIEITNECRVYGHLSRVFRCRVLENCFVTAGEDSQINIWDFKGNLVRKIECYQASSVWALEYNKEDNILITGRADGCLSAYKINQEIFEEKIILPNNESPKIVGILSSGNYVIISEKAFLFYFLKEKHTWITVDHLKDLESYVLLQVSHCRKIVALAGYTGQIYIYKENNNKLELVYKYQTRCQSRIFSFHWLTCKTFLICQVEGKLLLCAIENANKRIISLAKFTLPASKEPWSTCACLCLNSIIVGDRKGNLHVYVFKEELPVRTIKRAHDHLGVSGVYFRQYPISLGRNGVIKTYNKDPLNLECTVSHKTPFSWLAKIDNTLLLAFSGKNFLSFDTKLKQILFEAPCGGGHRSWDFVCNPDKAKFIFVKEKIIHSIQFPSKNFRPINLAEEFHVKETNAIKLIKSNNAYILLSGGEDTSIKVSTLSENNLNNIFSIKSHLSSIRCITYFKLSNSASSDDEEYLVVSGGGRAQIICWLLNISKNSEPSIHFEETFSYYKELNSQETETRIMDLAITVIDTYIMLFAACSDGNVNVFRIVNNSGKSNLRHHLTFLYKLKCIIKICCLKICDKTLLVTMATDGQVVFWDVTRILLENYIPKPLCSFTAHQSGINSYSYKFLKLNFFMLLTGGDDNSISVILFNYVLKGEEVFITEVYRFKDSGVHCAQITGAYICDKYFVTSSIDQRVAIHKYDFKDLKLICNFVKKYKTCITDLQGLECFEKGNNELDTIIYGNGLELLNVNISEN